MTRQVRPGVIGTPGRGLTGQTLRGAITVMSKITRLTLVLARAVLWVLATPNGVPASLPGTITL